MKAKSEITTTITVDLTAQDVDKIANHLGLVPKGWKFYSTELIGGKISEGGKMILRQTVVGDASGTPPVVMIAPE